MARINLLEEYGFLNINCVGGCNSCDWDIVANCYRKELVWPSFTKHDIRIKTFAPKEKSVGVYRDDYKYHCYAYLGDMQLTDGKKTKWDTYDEAYAFASNLVDSQQNKKGKVFLWVWFLLVRQNF